MAAFAAALLVGAFAAFMAAAVYAVRHRRSVISALSGQKAPGVADVLRSLAAGSIETFEKINAPLARSGKYAGIAASLELARLKNKPGLPLFVLYQEASALGLAGLTAALSYDALLSVAAGCAGFFLPVFYVNSRSRAAKEEIAQELPDALDIMAAAIEGGLSLNRAVRRYTEKNKGLFAEELEAVIKNTDFGMSFAEALAGMETRLGMPEVAAFVAALTRAERMGGNVKDTIKAQAEEMRAKRFQAMKKKAHEAPVKLLIPLIIFIFPVVFMVLFGPIIIRLMKGM